MMSRYDQDGIRFAIWVGPGRDPEVAYLDERQLVIGGAELTTDGWCLFNRGSTYNVLGGEVKGPIDPSVLHRISHTVLDRDGGRWFHLDDPDNPCAETTALCAVALPTPMPAMPYREPGAFHLGADFCVQWVTWTDPLRSGVLRRAVYMDDRYLMEGGIGPEMKVRVWPARGLMPHGLEHVAPTGREAAEIEDRVRRQLGPAT
jgi:hypothetical protein